MERQSSGYDRLPTKYFAYYWYFFTRRIMRARPVNPICSMAICVLLLPVVATAQQAWDKLDVVDGQNPTLRYGFFTEPTGQVRMGRYYFIDDGAQLRVKLAPYGRTAVELPVRRYDRNEGVLELGWEGKPDRACLLKRQNESLFLGNCIEKFVVRLAKTCSLDRHDSRISRWLYVRLALWLRQQT